jgi:hypothetical protein
MAGYQPKERAARLRPTRAMVPLICKLSDRIDGQLPSLIFDPTIVKKRTPAAVSLSHLQELQKNFQSNHVLLSHRSRDELLHLV